MQKQQLMNGLEEFFHSSYPLSSTLTPVNVGASSIGATDVVTTSSSFGKSMLKLIAVGGLIYLAYYFFIKPLKVYESDDRQNSFYN